MLRKSKAYIRQTRKGQVFKVVREHYLRDDIWCGAAFCSECKQIKPRLSDPKARLLIVDTNVVLHQIDVLESTSGAFEHLVFLQTVLEEVKHRNKRIYDRARALSVSRANCFVFSNEHHRSTYVERLSSESPNDRNDRAIRTATRWYKKHLESYGTQVLMLTNDRENKQKAQIEKLDVMTVADYVASVSDKYPELKDLLAQAAKNEEEKKANEWTFEKHKSGKDLQNGLDNGLFKKGTFRMNSFYEATVTVKGIEHPIFLPSFQSQNRAVDGDIVAVQILPKAQWVKPKFRVRTQRDMSMVTEEEDEAAKEGAVLPTMVEKIEVGEDGTWPTGRVVAVMQRNWRPYCGSLEETDKKTGSVYFIPYNKLVPRIRIESSQIQRLMDQRIIVSIDSWPASSKSPLGHFVKTLGKIGDQDTETTLLLMEHDIPHEPWSNNVLKCLPPDDWAITDEEAAKRVDLRGVKKIYSIDPPGCTDIDDALHCEPLPNGNFEVGVHIADVTHYVLPDSALDKEASNRGTSVYLVNKRIDMIPAALSTDLCSLREKEDRLAFSCIWELTPKAEIVNVKFHKSVICSEAAFMYSQAQERIDSDATDETTMCVKNLNNLAKCLRRRRKEEGSLELASAEVKFKLDRETKQPTEVGMYQTTEANWLVEEFMLLANVSVGKQILKHFPTFAMLRRHPTPPQEKFGTLIKAANQAGFEVDVSSSRALADSLDKCVVDGFPMFNKLMRILATRCMTQAVYFSSGELQPKDYHHYGLAAPVYTHFTSPIRRYADICVHWLLAASIGIAPLPAHIQDKARMRVVSDGINHRNRMAQLVSRASAELYTLIYFKDKKETAEALVIAVRRNGVQFLVPKYGLQSSIKLVTKEEEEQGSKWKYDEEEMTLTSPERQFKIFSRFRVCIYVKESKMRRQWLQIDLADDDDENVDMEGGAKVEEVAEEKSMNDEDDEDKESGDEANVEMEEEKEEARAVKPVKQTKTKKRALSVSKNSPASKSKKKVAKGSAKGTKKRRKA